jgi:hypothetical protein
MSGKNPDGSNRSVGETPLITHTTKPTDNTNSYKQKYAYITDKNILPYNKVAVKEVKAAPVNKAWEQKVVRDTSFTSEILERYTAALTSIGSATTPNARRNAEAALKLAVEQGAALFEDIHQGRKTAFSPSGQGYSDVANYRWQSGKSAGTVQALKKLKDIHTKGRKSFEESTYGMELPSTDTLIRRALTGGK